MNITEYLYKYWRIVPLIYTQVYKNIMGCEFSSNVQVSRIFFSLVVNGLLSKNGIATTPRPSYSSILCHSKHIKVPSTPSENYACYQHTLWIFRLLTPRGIIQSVEYSHFMKIREFSSILNF